MAALLIQVSVGQFGRDGRLADEPLGNCSQAASSTRLRAACRSVAWPWWTAAGPWADPEWRVVGCTGRGTRGSGRGRVRCRQTGRGTRAGTSEAHNAPSSSVAALAAWAIRTVACPPDVIRFTLAGSRSGEVDVRHDPGRARLVRSVEVIPGSR
jgi:hypothetical protein